MKKGIDVSVFQGDIDWKKVKDGKTDFAVIRGGYGRYEVDERFETNYKNAKKVKMPIGVSQARVSLRDQVGIVQGGGHHLFLVSP